MRLNNLTCVFALVIAMLSAPVLADFDLWYHQICFPGAWAAPWDCTYWRISAPAYDYNNICQGVYQGGFYYPPMCGSEMRMDGGVIGIMADCQKTNVQGAYIGTYYHSLFAKGPCYNWFGASSAKSCSGFPEFSYSLAACKVAAYGRP